MSRARLITAISLALFLRWLAVGHVALTVAGASITVPALMVLAVTVITVTGAAAALAVYQIRAAAAVTRPGTGGPGMSAAATFAAISAAYAAGHWVGIFRVQHPPAGVRQGRAGLARPPRAAPPTSPTYTPDPGRLPGPGLVAAGAAAVPALGRGRARAVSASPTTPPTGAARCAPWPAGWKSRLPRPGGRPATRAAALDQAWHCVRSPPP